MAQYFSRFRFRLCSVSPRCKLESSVHSKQKSSSGRRISREEKRIAARSIVTPLTSSEFSKSLAEAKGTSEARLDHRLSAAGIV
jgi:hypothetical protein